MYSIQEIAKASGTTSRTLRHYDEIGILKPARVGSNGYRYYDDRALVRLQRVLLLRELGLGLEAIRQVLEAQDAQASNGERAGSAEARILRSHLELLRQEQQRLAAQLAAVERTVAALETVEDDAPPSDEHRKKGTLMARNIFDGFDHTQYREEVERRWGAEAYRSSDRWWRGLGEEGRAAWRARVQQLNDDWIAAHERGEDPAGETAQELAQRHIDWLRSVPGTPSDVTGYVTGLAEMYVADERFAANYGGADGASFVRDALLSYLG